MFVFREEVEGFMWAILFLSMINSESTFEICYTMDSNRLWKCLLRRKVFPFILIFQKIEIAVINLKIKHTLIHLLLWLRFLFYCDLYNKRACSLSIFEKIHPTTVLHVKIDKFFHPACNFLCNKWKSSPCLLVSLGVLLS